MVEKPVADLQPPSEASHKSKHRHKEKKHKQRHRELGEASKRHRSGEQEPQHVGVASGSIALAADYNSDPESGELSDTTRLAQKQAEREQQSRLRAETVGAASAVSIPAPGATLTEYGVCPSTDASSESDDHLLQRLLCSNNLNLLQLQLQYCLHVVMLCCKIRISAHVRLSHQEVPGFLDGLHLENPMSPSMACCLCRLPTLKRSRDAAASVAEDHDFKRSRPDNQASLSSLKGSPEAYAAAANGSALQEAVTEPVKSQQAAADLPEADGAADGGSEHRSHRRHRHKHHRREHDVSEKPLRVSHREEKRRGSSHKVWLRA